MKWVKVSNGLKFLTGDEHINLNNFKISSNICTFYDKPTFDLDDITNISHNIFCSILSTCSTTDSNLHEINSSKNIYHIKISISLRIEYKNSDGIHIFNCSSYFSDFITYINKNIKIVIEPEIMFLWKNSIDFLNLSLNYLLIPIEI